MYSAYWLEISMWICATFLLLKAGTTLYWCPPEENILPCLCIESGFEISDVNCEEQNLTLHKIKKALGAMGNSQFQLRVVYQNLGDVKFDTFDGLHIRRLEFHHCKLDSFIDSDPPSASALKNSLRKLLIMGGFDDSKPLELGSFKNLEYFEMSSNSLKHVKSDWFPKGLGSLKELWLFHNEIENIDRKIFANLNDLQILNLWGNKLTYLERDMMPEHPYHLSILDFSENRISKISEDFFDGMISLKEVGLSMNLVKVLPEITWRSVWSQLEFLGLAENPLNCDSHMDWLLSIRRPKTLYGICTHPREKAGKHLTRLIDEN